MNTRLIKEEYAVDIGTNGILVTRCILEDQVSTQAALAALIAQYVEEYPKYTVALTQSKNMPLTTVSLVQEAISTTGAILMLFLVMAIYKKLNGIKVMW